MAIHRTVKNYTTGEETTVIEHEGLVLETGLVGNSFYDGYENNIDGLVWDEEKSCVKRITYSTTLGSDTRAWVDATAEVLAKAKEWKRKCLLAEWTADEKRRYLQKATTFAKGDEVTVVAGRKVAKGTTGIVFWMGQNNFGPGERVGIQTAAGDRHFTDAKNVSLPKPAPFVLDPERAARLEQSAVNQAEKWMNGLAAYKKLVGTAVA